MSYARVVKRGAASPLLPAVLKGIAKFAHQVNVELLLDLFGNLRALLADPSNPVRIMILYANRTEADILCQDTLKQIDELSNVSVWYTLDQPPEGWKYSSGFIDEAMCRDNLPPPGDTTYIFCCGPPPMIEYACKPNLAKMGHAANRIHCF